MARHRHIRSLNTTKDYEDFISDDDATEGDSPVTQGLKDVEYVESPTKSLNLSDFVISSPRHSKLKRKKEFETESPCTTSGVPIQSNNDRSDVNEEGKLCKKGNYAKSNSNVTTTTIVKKKLDFPIADDDVPGGSGFSNFENFKSKNSNLQKAMDFYEKRNMGGKSVINLVVVGHVDAGKSTLMGSMLVALGCISDRTISKYKRECQNLGKSSFAYAWVFDETSEERKRGTTMDVSQRTFDTDNNSIIVLDTPGHKDFISNMISGAAEADAAILVVDSSTGEFEAGFFGSGQTKEHLLLVKSLGICQLIVVVNKMDSILWKQDRFLKIVTELSSFLKKLGFENVQFIPCSGLLGVNLAKASGIPELNHWYNGPTLLDAINKLKAPERLITKPFRFPVSDIFKIVNKTSSVSGKIESGFIKVHKEILIMPEKQLCTVSKISLNDINVEYAFAGDQAELQLTAVDPFALSTGLVICMPENPISVSSKFRAKIVVFDIAIPLTNGFSVTFHRHSYCEQAVIHKLISSLNRSSGEILKKRPRFLIKNSCADVEIIVAKPACLELYKDDKELGRFLLRSKDVSIAAGMVTKLLMH